MSEFTRSVTKAFKDLLSRGQLSVESSAHDPHAFGNSVVVLAGKNFRVRLILDRGDMFAEATSQLEPENWFPLQRVIAAVGVVSPPAEGLIEKPEEVADLVDRHFDYLDAGLGPQDFDRTKMRLAELERLAIERLVNRAKD